MAPHAQPFGCTALLADIFRREIFFVVDVLLELLKDGWFYVVLVIVF